jgi:hypothetical protein
MTPNFGTSLPLEKTVKNEIIGDTGDTYTSSARPNRGYHAYERFVTFSAGTDVEFVTDTLKALKSKMDMWFSAEAVNPVDARIEPTRYRISHGWDSGD